MTDGTPSGLPGWLDDGPVDADRASISPLDAGLRSGLGVFETLRAHGTRTLAADRHVARLAAGAARLDIAVDADRITSALVTTLAVERDVAEVVVRVTVTAGPTEQDAWPATPLGRPTLSIVLHPAPPLPLPPLRAVTAVARRWPADLKSTSYLANVLAVRTAIASGADTAVLVDGAELLETAEGNLVAVLAGSVVTPAADGRLLPGVTRELVLEEAERLGMPVREAALTADDLADAEVVMATSAVGGIRTIRTLDGRRLPGSGAEEPLHPLVPALRSALEARRG